MRLCFTLSLVALVFIASLSCAKKPDGSDAASADSVVSGDIIVSNGGNDSLLLFNSAGKFKKVLYSVDTTSGEALTGIVYNRQTDQVLVAVDGVDRIVAIDADGGEIHNFVLNAQFTGTPRGLTQLPSGDILAVEGTTVERFLYDGTRVVNDTVTSSGAWPKTLMTNNTEISAMPDGGFVICSNGTDAVRVYDSTATQTANAVSGIAATTDVVSCISGPGGNSVYAVFSGTTDTVRKYNADLSTTEWSYSNLTVLSTPAGMAIRANGNILVLDSAFNHVVEIAPDGTLVGTLKGDDIDIDNMLSSPQYIYVVP